MVHLLDVRVKLIPVLTCRDDVNADILAATHSAENATENLGTTQRKLLVVLIGTDWRGCTLDYDCTEWLWIRANLLYHLDEHLVCLSVLSIVPTRPSLIVLVTNRYVVKV